MRCNVGEYRQLEKVLENNSLLLPITGDGSEMRDRDVKNRLLSSIDKAKKLLDYKPQMNIDEHRYDYNNSINIFHPARTTHKPHFPEVPA